MTTLTRQEKRALRLKITRMMDETCGACDKKPAGISGEVKIAWCIRQCPFAKELQQLAAPLNTSERMKPRKPKVQLKYEKHVNEIVFMLYEGLSIPKIAEKYNVNRSTLQMGVNKLVKRGLMPSPEQIQRERMENWIQKYALPLLRAGKTVGETALHLQIKQTTLNMRLHKYGYRKGDGSWRQVQEQEVTQGAVDEKGNHDSGGKKTRTITVK
ncbi:hypothetical protein [Ectobacillus antri]|uniref:hypothetical protein n=1 Tax=Ectobacillus antri TaxID=2486280 RepID=UPI000F59F3DE|nr:hypothetical protein [Ectobacillus antri]